MNNEMTNKEEFEKWAIQMGFDVLNDAFGDYVFPGTAFAWNAWQARQPEIDALKAEVEQLRKDAERYQWLREHVYEIDFWGDEFTLNRDQLDGHIDAAMKEAK